MPIAGVLTLTEIALTLLFGYLLAVLTNLSLKRIVAFTCGFFPLPILLGLTYKNIVSSYHYGIRWYLPIIIVSILLYFLGPLGLEDSPELLKWREKVKKKG